MHSVRSALLLLALLLLSTVVSGAPSRIQKRSFRVERIRNRSFKGHNGQRSLLKAYRKYNMKVPEALTNAVAAQDLVDLQSRDLASTLEALLEALIGKGNQDGADGDGNSDGNGQTSGGASGGKNNSTTGGQETAGGKGKGHDRGGAGGAGGIARTNSTQGGNSTQGTKGVGIVTATPERNDVEYLSPVTIGGQTLNLDFDSGSSDLWVFNTQLSAKARQGHTVYDPSESPTFQPMQGANFTIQYGDGSGAAGNVGTDTVDIGGAVVAEQAIELATAVSASFVQDAANNGLVGLAFSKLNTVRPQQQRTFFDNVMASLAEPVFTADLRRGAVGAYEFGRVDQSKFTGGMRWVPVNTTQGFWQFASTSFAVGEDGGAQRGDPAGQAIADTGTTLILANEAIVSGYFAQVEGAKNDPEVGGITVPCDGQLPDLMLDVGGVMARVKGADIIFSRVQGNTCFAGVQPTTSSLMVFGDIFFKSQFVAFNGGNNTLGIAEHV